MRPVRNSAKAIIIEDGRLLTVAKAERHGAYYILPGGGQHPGETLEDAVRRECREELGADVTVGELVWIREYIGVHHEFGEQDADFHQIEFMFLCALVSAETLGSGHLLDDHQTGIAWIPLAALEATIFYPAALRPLIARLAGQPPVDSRTVVYLGDVN
jgi:8-oxo-dGTP pyrophosphatase MutT (NUDIX family)